MNELYRSILNKVKVEHSQSVNRKRNSRVLIIDSLNTFIRSWTTNPTMDDNGNHIGGITGFLKSIGYAIREINPTRVILVFDGKKGSTDRKKIYDGYKSDRGNIRFRVNRQYPDMMSQEEEKESMRKQLLKLIEILDELPLTTMIYDGIEADDVIGFLATSVVKDDEQCVIMSTDKDFIQLVSPTTLLYSPTKKIVYNKQKVFDEYGIYPQNFAIFRAMDGDESDNVPGIRGCGLKTLIKRIPELTENREIELEGFVEMCKVKRDTEKYKIFGEILDNENILRRNYRLMQLSDPVISTDHKLKIINRYNETLKPVDKFNFMKTALHHKIIGGWTNLDSWLKETFSNIIVNE